MTIKRLILLIPVLLGAALLLTGCTTSVNVAVGNGDMQKVRQLLANGANVNEQSPGPRLTPLMQACLRDNTECVRLLLDNGANTEMRDRHGRTALIISAENGHTQCVQLLLDKGADINAKNGKTLHGRDLVSDF